jgi:hypothetical protein
MDWYYQSESFQFRSSQLPNYQASYQQVVESFPAPGNGSTANESLQSSMSTLPNPPAKDTTSLIPVSSLYHTGAVEAPVSIPNTFEPDGKMHGEEARIEKTPIVCFGMVSQLTREYTKPAEHSPSRTTVCRYYWRM